LFSGTKFVFGLGSAPEDPVREACNAPRTPWLARELNRRPLAYLEGFNPL